MRQECEFFGLVLTMLLVKSIGGYILFQTCHYPLDTVWLKIPRKDDVVGYHLELIGANHRKTAIDQDEYIFHLLVVADAFDLQDPESQIAEHRHVVIPYANLAVIRGEYYGRRLAVHQLAGRCNNNAIERFLNSQRSPSLIG